MSGKPLEKPELGSSELAALGEENNVGPGIHYACIEQLDQTWTSPEGKVNGDSQRREVT